MLLLRWFALVALAIILAGCGGSSASSAGDGGGVIIPDSSNPVEQTFDSLVLTDMQPYAEVSTRFLDADGQNTGLSAYDLIRVFGGSNPIESPDLYLINHPEVPHIYEDNDPDIGEHFVFVIHRDLDRDRDRIDITDRQRNEIKSYASSEDAVKGYENETMVFRWKFRINAQMEVSRNFSHFFQLKAVGGDDSQPIITLTGNERSSEDGFEIRHSPAENTTVLDRIEWSQVTGEWIEVYCRATFAENGSLRLIASRLSDGEVLFDVDETGLDMWRGETVDHFVRPKWGIYRSLLDAENLRPEEEDVRFANFRVNKVELQ